MRPKRTRGFTLTEILVTTLIFSLLVGSLFIVMSSGWVASGVGVVSGDLNYDLRNAMIWLAEDIRQSGNAAISNLPDDGQWRNTISFYIPSGVAEGLLVWDTQDITYSIGGANLSELLRSYAGEQRIIARNVSSFRIRRQSTTPRIVEISITVQKNTFLGRLITANLDFQVKLRN